MPCGYGCQPSPSFTLKNEYRYHVELLKIVRLLTGSRSTLARFRGKPYYRPLGTLSSSIVHHLGLVGSVGLAHVDLGKIGEMLGTRLGLTVGIDSGDVGTSLPFLRSVLIALTPVRARWSRTVIAPRLSPISFVWSGAALCGVRIRQRCTDDNSRLWPR